MAISPTTASQIAALEAEVRNLSELKDITKAQDLRLSKALAELETAKGYRDGRARPVNADAHQPFNVNRNRSAWESDDPINARARQAVAENRVASDEQRQNATELLERCADDVGIASHVHATSDPRYIKAFNAYVANPQGYARALDPDELRVFTSVNQRFGDRSPAQFGEARTALTLGLGAVLIPQHLDPSIVLTNGGVTSPIRSIADVRTTSVDQLDFVTSPGSDGEWLSEGTQVADATSVLTGPTVSVHKGAVYSWASIEMAMDSDYSSQVGRLFADARDRLEGAAFITGTGSGQPWGLITRLSGAGPVVAGSSTGGANSAEFVLADLYNVDNALAPRWQENASWVTSRYFANEIRRLASALPSQTVWSDFANNVPPGLLGHPVYTASTMATYPVMGAVGATTCTSGSADYPIMLLDASSYKIVDRIGMSLIEHDVMGAQGRPTFQKGFAAFFRVGADVIGTSTCAKVLKL